MLDHHIQQAIVYRLAFADSMKFTELKPDVLDNKLFTYHLQKVIKAGLAEKTADGRYQLTALGRQLGTRAADKQLSFTELPESVFFLVIRRASDKAWLLYRRNTHPLRAHMGFMHCLPDSEATAELTAQKECHRLTGLTGEFTALGGGYSRIYHDAKLESFTNFTLLYCDDIKGELHQTDDYADYFWSVDPDFSSSEFFPSALTQRKLYEAKQSFFTEYRFVISD